MSVLPAGSRIDYTITWLEMTERPSYPRPHHPLSGPVQLLCARTPPVWYFLDLYRAVGTDYSWEDMFEAGEEDLASWIQDPDTELWTLLKDGWPNGFFFLDHREPETCDLSYFGLAPQAIGRGLGRFMLETAIHIGWDFDGVTRMTVNTNTLDHPRALGLYQRCGFEPVRRTEHERILTRPRDVSRIPN
ncbi:N-acetyltransferase [Tropicimonas sp. IMCC34011]|uniref:GNAT family N-acetyltransferase n=1 Tax=Tropicimonas sp. IMCC34011 TaxID=2248759 RepID=UPI000E25CBA7|nr:GNAT family N-acetyltransferase [Tropicimonas sp. IMCC34011]